MIPDLDAAGNLPPGVHSCTWQEFEQRFATTRHRRELLNGLRRALIELKAAGCATAYIDGSFVTEKKVPADYDGCWDPRGVVLSKLDPVLQDLDNGRARQKAKYRGELFPSTWGESGSGGTFLDFFQVDRATGEAKGILALDLQRECL